LDKKKTSYAVFQYSTIGIQLAATVTLFVIGGYNLDEYLNRSPIFTIVGAFAGMGIGFYHLIKQLTEIERREKDKKNQERKNWLI
jgi:F0F1-type ATP synthase assembly protein I